MNKKMISMVTFLLVAVTVGVFASSPTGLTGSDFVRLGNLGIVSGELSEEDGEWYLTSEDKEYALHLGNYEVIYPQGIDLEEGSEAVVRGFVLENDISAVRVVSEDSAWDLRTEAGVPLWAGKGNRENQLSNSTDRLGMGNYTQMSQRSNAMGNYSQMSQRSNAMGNYSQVSQRSHAMGDYGQSSQVERGAQPRFNAPIAQTPQVGYRNNQRPMGRF